MTLADKIARLVAERGWNQEAFARAAGLNRGTAREILLGVKKRLRNETVRRCADALELPVHELVELPLAKLLPRMRSAGTATPSPGPLADLSAQPELQAWLERNPTRAAALSREDIEELLSLQGTGGPLTQYGVEHFVKLIERKRELKKRVEVIAGTEYVDLLEQLVGLIYERIQPYRDT